tara:strand:- start:351 stop:479 length:129 start_codon:yes stop_codon:yes gene_type:complete
MILNIKYYYYQMIFELILFFGGLYLLVSLFGRVWYEEGMDDD